MTTVQDLKVSDNRRFLVQADGTPFFWLGDTAWELFHALNREEAERYLRNRAELGFNVIQAVALAEFEGVTTDNAYGRRPLKTNADGAIEPSQPDIDGEYSYWEHMDYIVDLAGALGLYIALLPTWGDKYNLMWGKGPEIFTPANAFAFGAWIGDRYKDRSNIVWVLGGDRPLTTRLHFEITHAMADGIRTGDGGRHLVTFHPRGGESSSVQLHEESWLDFNMIQSGHGDEVRSNYKKVAEDYVRTPVKPTLDAEPCYEDHPRGFKAANGYFDDFDVRVAAYYNVFAGGFGHTYGHHSIWSMTREPADYFIMHWEDALHRPGARQMRHLRSLIESRPMLERVPDQSLIIDNGEGSNYAIATRGERYAFVYSANGLKLKIAMGKIAGAKVLASWYDPRMGETRALGEFDNSRQAVFIPPLAGRGSDWVLVLDGIR